MWTDKETTLDLTHNPEELWFAGIFGRPVAKPTAILKWEGNANVYQLITKKFPRTKASAVLDDLGIIALEYAKTIVRQRQTFRSNSKAENVAPLTFEYDPDGEFALVAAVLRSKRAPSKTAEDGKAEDGDGERKEEDLDSLTGIDPNTDPPLSSDTEDATPADVTFQHTLLDAMITEPESGVGKKDKKIVQMYLSLNASEFLYVRELQRAYDETRCYFCQWVVSKEMKELINSARLTHINAGMDFNWTCVRREILNNLTDITHTARLLSLTQLERGQISAKLWVSQVTSKRALLEDKDLRHPILLPEIVYLELVLGRISPQRKLYDDIKKGRCTRCHKTGHYRA